MSSLNQLQVDAYNQQSLQQYFSSSSRKTRFTRVIIASTSSTVILCFRLWALTDEANSPKKADFGVTMETASLPARVPREAVPFAARLWRKRKNYSTSFSSTSSSVRLTGVHFSSTKEDGKSHRTPTYSQSLSTFLSNNGGCQFVTNLGRSSLR